MAKAKDGRKSWKRVALAAALVLLAVFFIASYLGDKAVMRTIFERQPADPHTIQLVYDDIADDYDRVPVSLQASGYNLQGYIYGPENSGKGLVVFSHGIWSQHQDYLALIMYLVDNGWKVLAYDNIGCGESEGDSTISFAQSAVTLDQVLDYVEASAQEPDSPFAGLPVVLMGHSWGGFAVTGVLNWDHDVAAVVSLSGFESPMGIMMEGTKGAIGAAAYTQYPTMWLANRQRCGEYAGLSAVRGINKAGIPVLVVHGTGDETIGYNGAAIIAHRSQITNPNVEYLTMDVEGRNGHATYFYSIESQVCYDNLVEQRQELVEQHDGAVSEDEMRAFMASVDKRAANEADPGLMSQVDEFFSRAISG